MVFLAQSRGFSPRVFPPLLQDQIKTLGLLQEFCRFFDGQKSCYNLVRFNSYQKYFLAEGMKLRKMQRLVSLPAYHLNVVYFGKTSDVQIDCDDGGGICE